MKWLRVNPKKPCPICQKKDWCGYSEDGRFAICMRVPSGAPSSNGGYLHRLTDEPCRIHHPPVRRSTPVIRRFDDLLSAWTAKTLPEALQGLAASLGVSTSALNEIGTCWADPHRAWAFPMRDGAGQIVGVRLRSDDGRKWSVRGSKEGLFYPKRAPLDHVAVICEGPTDTAAALALNLFAIGRPSCMGAVAHVKAVCTRLRVTHLIVIADNDSPKPRPGGGWWVPGLDGARRMIEEVGLDHKLVLPPAKDLRAWVGTGATHEEFNALAHQQNWRT